MRWILKFTYRERRYSNWGDALHCVLVSAVAKCIHAFRILDCAQRAQTSAKASNLN